MRADGIFTERANKQARWNLRRLDRTRLFCLLAYGIGSVVWIWIACNLPYSWDDWEWGSSTGLEYFKAANQNGRYLGNILEMAMTRSTVLKNVILSAVYAAIPILGAVIAAKVTKASLQGQMVSYIIASVLFLVCNRDMWKETIGWVAGAVNFVIVFLLVELYILVVLTEPESNSPDLKQWEKPRRQSSISSLLGGIALGFSMELFSENISIVAVAVSIAIYLYTVYTKKKSLALLGLVIGNIVGLVSMLTSSVYLTLFRSGSAIGGYRTLSFEKGASLLGILKKCVGLIIGRFIPTTLGTIAVIPVALSVCSLAILLLKRQKSIVAERTIAAVSGVIVLYLLGVEFGNLPILFKDRRLSYLLHGMLTSDVLWVLMGVEIWMVFDSAQDRFKKYVLLGLLIGGPLLMFPLCVTSASTPRIYFSSNGLMVILATALFYEVFRCMSSQTQRGILAAGTIIFAALCVRWGTIYADIGATTARRLEAISRAQDGKTTEIYLEKYKYEEYLVHPDTFDGNHSFREFYGVPDDAVLVFELPRYE